MAEQFSIRESTDGGARLVRVSGELDIATAAQLDGRLRALLEQHERVVLDLSELSFLDSTGLAVLVGAARLAENDGGSFAVSAISSSAQRVLELSGVAEKLNLSPKQG